MQVQVLGIAWYRPGNFLRLRAMFEDGNRLHATYDGWLGAAEIELASHVKKGIKTLRVDIDPIDFPRWCIHNGYRLDAGGRAAYCSFVTAQPYYYPLR